MCAPDRFFISLTVFELSLGASTVHIPVMLREVMDAIDQLPDLGDKIWIDGTLGGAGHSCSLLTRLSPQDLLVGFDRDSSAIARSEERIQNCERSCKVKLVQSSYKDIPRHIEQGDFGLADMILLDLGLSSDQLADSDRGFSFRLGGPLDLRFDTEAGISAAEYLARATEQDIANTIYQYGEERFSRRIARAIVAQRLLAPIRTAEELSEIVHRSVPGKIHGRIDSATRTFQALRIYVNRELEHLETAMKTLPECLKPQGRLIVISFHSLEDRIVKHAMRDSAVLDVITKKPILPSDSEINTNPRSRSAKLRIAARKPST